MVKIILQSLVPGGAKCGGGEGRRESWQEPGKWLMPWCRCEASRMRFAQHAGSEKKCNVREGGRRKRAHWLLG